MSDVVSSIANSKTTLGTHWYTGGSSWVTGTPQGASQGSYQKSTDSYVGAIVFNNLGTTLIGKYIESIVFTISTDGGSARKDVVFWESTKQTFTFTSSTSGSSLVGTKLGTLPNVEKASNKVYTLNSTTNSELFDAMAKYLAAGNNTLVVYNGEKSSSSSPGYARLIYVKIEVTYSDSPPTTDTNTVWYRVNNQWVKCAMYYRTSNDWVRVTPYYRSNNAWIQV